MIHLKEIGEREWKIKIKEEPICVDMGTKTY